jgi:O-succinylbenzoic acid--CoA ligase
MCKVFVGEAVADSLEVNWGHRLPQPCFLENPLWDKRTSEFFHLLQRQAPQLDDHFWLASSGSSATAESPIKLIALNRQAILASSAAVNAHLSATGSDVWLRCLPEFHVGGLAISARAFLSGSDVAIMNTWDVDRFLQTVDEKKVSLTSLVPTQVYDLVARGCRAPRELRAIVVGGARLEPDLYIRARKLNWPLLPSYGMTEAGSQIATANLDTLSGPAPSYPALQVLPHVQCKIDNEGRLYLRSESLLTGILQVTEGNATFSDPREDGWLATSDRAKITATTIEPLGRMDEVVKILGELVSLADLRSRWTRHLQIENCVNLTCELVDLPQERTGREIVLAVQDASLSQAGLNSSTLNELIQRFNQAVNPVGRIQRVTYVTEIPRSALGKTLWENLREILAQTT